MIKTFEEFIKEQYNPNTLDLILEEYEFSEDPGKDFGEHWEKLTPQDKIYKYIEDRLPKYDGKREPGIMDVYKCGDEDVHYVAYIHGGENGPGSWVDYCEYIKNIFSNVTDSWLLDLVNDCADDVWTMRLGFREK